MPAMGVLMERLAISALLLYHDTDIDLPVVCKKFSCPQGNSRSGALIGHGADGCSVYARCESARSNETREKDMMDGHTLLMSEETEEVGGWWVVAGDLDVQMHARMPGG
jgi:hypothetical protein